VSKVGFRKTVGKNEEDNHRKFLLVGLPDGIFQGVVVFGPLGGLHPVEHEPAFLKGPVVQFPDPFRMDHGSFLLVFLKSRD
jgi:hypothetical protein